MHCVKKNQALSIEHQKQISGVWRRMCLEYDLQFAEYSFANAFLFRRQHQYSFIPCEHPLIRGEFRPNHYYYIPTCGPRHCDAKMIKNVVGEQTTLFPIPESWLAEFSEYHPQIVSCRQDSDYIYDHTKLETLKGRGLSSRRNLLHQFESYHQVESKAFTPELIEDGLKVLEEWQRNSHQAPEKTDYLSCRDAFDHFVDLELIGRIAYAEGIPVGFAIGELLTPKTALLHLSKTLHSYKGVTPFLYRDFALHLPDTVEWINLEQDLGIPSLRHAKEAYEPDMLLPKYRVTF